MHNLLLTVKSDILKFFNDNSEILFNERDLQMHLTIWLKKSTNNYDDVDIEYYIPSKELVGHIWDSELRLDIVVRKDNEYLPIEIKYKTKKVECEIERFGEKLNHKITVIKDQSAQDIGKYGFWKDIKRLELICERFKNVKNAISIFLTNDQSYTKESSSTSSCYQFNMNEGLHSTTKHWLNEKTTCARKFEGFNLKKEYYIKWYNKTAKDIKFYYCIVEI